MPLAHIENQLTLQLAEAEKVKRIPSTINDDGNMHWTKEGFDWTKGFFPGSLW